MSGTAKILYRKYKDRYMDISMLLSQTGEKS